MRLFAKKKTKYIGLVGITSLFTLLASCSSAAIENTASLENATFRTFVDMDYLHIKNTPLNPVFSDAPIGISINSALIGLTDYETTGLAKFNEEIKDGNRTLKVTQKTDDNLRLEAAVKVEVFKDEESMKKYDQMQKMSRTTSTSSNGNGNSNGKKDYWVFEASKTKDKALPLQEGYDEAVANGKVYRFSINREVGWVDPLGNERQKLSAKDFEKGLMTYYLTSKTGFNRSDYFIDLIGLDVDKMLGQMHNGKMIYPDDVNYDANKFKSNDDTFVMYLKSPYVYALDLISKEHFSPLPHTNRRVRNITLQPGGAVVKNERNQLDQIRTNFNEIFGAGELGKFLTDETWFAGPYYVSDYTANQLIFRYNNSYAKSAGQYFANINEKKIQRVIVTFGFGNQAAFYELFKSNQADEAIIPETLTSEAVRLFKNNGLFVSKSFRLPRSYYLSYTPRPYIPGPNGPEINANIDEAVAKFIWRFNSKDSLIVRAGLYGLINHNDLSKINFPRSGDFQLSSLPYGNLPNYYEAISEDLLYGGLPRKYSDYLNNQNRLLDHDGGFEIPYYDFDKKGSSDSEKSVGIEKLKVNKQTFIEALKRLGATKEKPFVLSTKFFEPTFTTNFRDYLNHLIRAVNEISDGLVEFNVVGRNAPSPSLHEWYNGQQAPVGFATWNADYTGVGTWLESFSKVQQIPDPKGTKQLEAISATNGHNAFNSYIQDAVFAIKLMGYKWNASSKKYCLCNGVDNMCMNCNDLSSMLMNKTDPYANDDRIQKAFSDATLKRLYGNDILTKTKLDGNVNIQSQKPGIRYAQVSIGFLNYLISKGFLDQTEFDKFVKDPSLLSTENKTAPSSNDQIIITNKVVKQNQSPSFGKYLGEYVGLNKLNELWGITVPERDFWYIPRSDVGLNHISITLVNPRFLQRNSQVSYINYRDYKLNV